MNSVNKLKIHKTKTDRETFQLCLPCFLFSAKIQKGYYLWVIALIHSRSHSHSHTFIYSISAPFTAAIKLFKTLSQHNSIRSDLLTFTNRNCIKPLSLTKLGQHHNQCYSFPPSTLFGFNLSSLAVISLQETPMFVK